VQQYDTTQRAVHWACITLLHLH